MKYLFVHDHVLNKLDDNYYSNGGLSNQVMKRYLFRDEDSITLYTRQKKVITIDEKKLVKVNDERVFCKPSLLYHSPKDYYKKNKIIKNEIKQLICDADMIVIRIPSFLGFFAYEEAIKQKKKYVLEMVACPWDSFWNHSSIYGKILAPLVYLKTRNVCKKAQNIIYVSNEFLQQRYPTDGNSVAISNVNIEEINDNVLEARKQKITDIKKQEKIKIGLIGSSSVDFKGHFEAIQMANILKKENYKFEVHFLGAGKKEKWEKLIKEYNLEKEVYFDGTLPSGQPVLNWLDDIDIYIIPSLQEGLPRALIEAMSRGCPAVGMRTGGIPELLDNKFICEKKDYETLAKNVKFLMNDTNIMMEQSVKNFNVSKKYLKKDLDEKRKDFFEKIINN